MKKFTRSEIEAKVNEILVEQLYNVKASEIRPDARLMSDLGADSIDAVDVYMEIEKAFYINIPDDYVLKEMNVREVCDLVERLQR